MHHLVSPKEFASAIGVSESSIKRWCDRGELELIRTAGGHRRLPMRSILRFLRKTGRPLVEPALIGFPADTGRHHDSLAEASQQLRDALIEGDEQSTLSVIWELYLQQYPISIIGDDVIAMAMYEIGEKWDCGDIQVFQERRSCETCMKALHELRRLLLPPVSGAPLAIGATIEEDPYTLPLALSELVLLENNWNASLLGNSLPFEAMVKIIESQQPLIFWLSVSYLTDENKFVEGCEALFQSALEHGTVFIVGGQALTPGLRRRIKYGSFCDTLQHLEQTAKMIKVVKHIQEPKHAAS